MPEPSVAADFLRRAREGDGNFAAAYATLMLAEAQDRMARQLAALGTGNAVSEMGAIEFLAATVGAKLGELAGAIEALGERLADAADRR
jgi:hypothetical protein